VLVRDAIIPYSYLCRLNRYSASIVMLQFPFLRLEYPIKPGAFVDIYEGFSTDHHKKLNHQLNVITQAINEDIQENGNEYGVEVFPHIHNHMLRHTIATRMREAGADIKATSNILGHTKTSITLDIYTDASTEFKNREIGVLDKYYPEEDM